MAKNKTTYTLQIDAELGNLESKLSSVKGLLAGVLGSANAPKGLEKTIEKIEGLIDRVKAKASQPIDSKAGFTSISKDVDSAQVALSGLLKIVQSINSLPEADRLSFLPPDAQAQIQKVVDGLSAYAAAIDAATTESQELAAARAELAKADEKVAKAQEKLDQRTANLDAAKIEKQAAEDAIQAIEDRKKKLAELRAEQEKIEKFYDTPDENGQKRNKSKKYSEVSMRPQDIKRKVADMEKAVAADDAVIDSYREQLKGAKNDVDSYIKQVSAANRALKDATTEHDALEKKVQDLNDEFEASKPKNQQAAFEALRKEASALGVSLDGISDTFSDADASELIKRLVDIKTKGLDKVGKAADKATIEVAEFGTGLKNIKDDVEEGTEALEGMTEAAAQKEAFENKIKQFLGLSGAAQLLRAALRDAMATVKELDATMTEMAVVTDLTVGDYWDQLPEYSKRASDLGVSINSAYKAATLYYQQGLKTNEVVALSNETLKMAKIAGIDAAEATDKMTAALRGFNMELNEASAQKIADVYSELAAITAADVDEISTAMTKTASIASSAGMEFETTAAFLSQIIETTRESAETAGTAMKTVIARFQELKKSPDEIGEVDGEIVDANAIETALRSVGVLLRDAGGQFRELDDVFLELSSKWSSLDKNTQRYIATIAAGSRQQSRFIAMMQDYSRTQELVTAANASAGASQRQFEKTMESLQAKVEKLKNAWHEFTMGIMNSDLVKFGVDALTKLLEIVNKATSAFDGFAGSLTKISTVLAVFKVGKSLFQKIPENFKVAMVDVIRQAIEGGEKAAEGAAEGARRKQQELAKQDASQPQDPSPQQPTQQPTQQMSLKQKISASLSNKTGLADWTKAQEKFRVQKGTRDTASKIEVLKKKKAGLDQGSAAEIKKIDDEIKAAEKDLKMYSDYQEKLGEDGKTAWQNVSDSVQKAGQAMTGAGVAFSLFGGILDSLGLEEAGNFFANIGNFAMIAGSAVSALGPVIVSIVGKLVAGGMSTLAAWAWVAGVVLGIMLLVGAVVAIAAAIKNASPEEKLKKTQETADKAAEAADRATESYNNLKDSLSGLDDGYDALENMRRGTDEWNEAVQKLNNSVLDLINQYPELAGLVENEGGVLTLDIDSQAVQDVLQSYKDKVATTKGAELGMKAQVVEAQQQVDFANLETTKKIAKQRGWQSAATALNPIAAGIETAKLAGGGFGGVMAGIGTGLLSLIPGGAYGVAAINGGITSSKTANDDKLEANTEALAEWVTETGKTSKEDMFGYLTETLKMPADEAKIMAETFAEDTDALLEYGATLNETNAAQKAYYQAMATNAQSMIDLGKYSEEALNQMSSIVDADRIKAYEDELKDTYEDDDSEATEAALKKYMEGLEGVGEVKRIKNNKIVYIDDEGKKQKVDKETYIQQMIAAQATEDAAKAMEAVPEALSKAVKAFGDNLSDHETFKKAFSADEGMALNASELVALDYKELESIYAEMGEAGKEIWATQIEFIADYQERVEKANKAFEDAVENMQELGFESNKASELFGQMSAESAKAWTKTLQTINMGGGDTQAFHNELTTLLRGLSEEQVNAVMGQINAIDMADIDAWENLKYVFDDLNIPIATDALQKFIDKGIEVSNAIEKIDFDGLNESLNNTYELIKKIKEDSSRSFGEEEYKKFVASNKELEKQFMQIGDEFVYMGGSIQDLVTALEENTVANIEEANRQLDSKIVFSGIAAGIEKKTVDDMDEAQLREYLNEAISKSSREGLDVADLGVAGFSNASDLYAEGVDKDILLKWAQAFAATGGQKEAYEKQKREGMHQANVLKYAYRNTAAENAAGRGSAYAEALQYQAIQSGGVSDAQLAAFDQTIEALKIAEESGDAESIQKAQDNVDKISSNIATATERIVESNQGRDAMQDLVDRVTDALYDQTQKEIDKLQEIKDATEEANTTLITKLQEQIDTSRQQKKQEKEHQNIANMQSQMAYLNMDTSGANSLEMVGLEQQIDEAEQAYQEALIDQAIQQLQDANEEAAEQRERQINLLQAQLDQEKDSGKIAERAAEIAKTSVQDIENGVEPLNTSMGQLLWSSEGEGLGKLEKETWVSNLSKTAVSAGKYLASLNKSHNKSSSSNTNVVNSPKQNTPITEVSNLASGTTQELEETKSKFRQFFTEDLPQWWNEHVAKFFTGAFWSEKWSAIKAWWDETVAPIFTGEFWSEKFFAMGQAIGNFILKIGETFKAVKGALVDTWQNISEFFSVDVVNWWQENIAPIFTREFWAQKWAAIKEGLASAWQNFTNFFTQTIPSWWETNIAPIFTKEFWSSKWSSFLDGLKQVWQDVSTWWQANVAPKFTKDYWVGLVGKIGEGLKTGFESAINAVIRGINSALKKLSEIYNNSIGSFIAGVASVFGGEDVGKITYTEIQPVKFKEGGLANFTGPAWLDGTPSKPEYILNAAQTERFFSLIDVLEGYDAKEKSSKSTGDNYFDIDINVEKIEDDYDVEQIANKIRRMIYEDATYRNVNAISHIR